MTIALVGLALAGVAAFIWWMSKKSGAPAAGSGSGGPTIPGGFNATSLLNPALGLVMASIKEGISFGGAVLNGGIGLTGQAVDATVKAGNAAVNVGGKLVGGFGNVGAKVVSLNGQVVKTLGFDLPKAAVGTAVGVATSVGKEAVNDVVKVGTSTVGAVKNFFGL